MWCYVARAYLDQKGGTVSSHDMDGVLSKVET